VNDTPEQALIGDDMREREAKELPAKSPCPTLAIDNRSASDAFVIVHE
jgi:hypothetical protein